MTNALRLAALTIVLAAAAAPAAEMATLEVDRNDLRRHRSQRSKVLKLARRWAQQNPERWQQLVGDSPRLAPGSVPTRFRGRNGEPVDTVLDSLQQVGLAVGHTELKRRDKRNLANLYTSLHGMIPEKYRDGLPDPAAVQKQSTKKLLRAVRLLAELLDRDFHLIRLDLTTATLIPVLLGNPIGVCENEIGWEGGGSDVESSERCDTGDYASLGLMDNVDWVLKDDITCVKDQKRRGTCVAHTVAANVESHVMIDGGAAENLGEQNIYFWGKVVTDWGDRYTDGLSPDALYDGLDADNYLIQYESIWNYNQSTNRGSLAGNTYPNSCGVAYTGELCTDFAFQGTEDLSQIPFLYTHPAYSQTDGREVVSWTSIPDLGYLGLPDFQIDTAVVALESEVPIHLSVSVPDAFRNPDANGYVNHVAGETAGAGSHSILAVGFVGNAEVPAGAPLDPAGVGYFVIKNSWGLTYGDCGFAYLSYDFVKRWAYAYRYIEVI